MNISNVIPCEECSEHLKKTLKEMPDIEEYLDTREKLFEWTIILHNKVNKMLGHGEQWSVKKAKKFYLHPFFRFKEDNRAIFNFYTLFFIVLIIGLIYMNWRLVRKMRVKIPKGF